MKMRERERERMMRRTDDDEPALSGGDVGVTGVLGGRGDVGWAPDGDVGGAAAAADTARPFISRSIIWTRACVSKRCRDRETVNSSNVELPQMLSRDRDGIRFC